MIVVMCIICIIQNIAMYYFTDARSHTSYDDLLL